MEPRTHCLLAALLLPLAAPAPAPAPASPAERTNIALRKQIAAPEVLLRATVPPGEEVTQSLDVPETTQALVCSQIFGVLPFRTFRRQRFDSFTTCTCVSGLRAQCEPETFYPTVAPGTPEAVHAQEQAGFGADKFIQVLNAFSVQQTCFFEHLRGQNLSPPRPCAFSWVRGERPACDCAQPPAVVAAPEEVEAAEVTEVQSEPETTQQAPAAAAEAEATDPVTARSTKAAVQSVIRDGGAAAEAVAEAAVVLEQAVEQAVERAEVAADAVPAGTAVVGVVEVAEPAVERAAALSGEQRRPVPEESHLRRVRSARRH